MIENAKYEIIYESQLAHMCSYQNEVDWDQNGHIFNDRLVCKHKYMYTYQYCDRLNINKIQGDLKC